MSNERAMFGKQLKKEREEFRKYEEYVVKLVCDQIYYQTCFALVQIPVKLHLRPNVATPVWCCIKLFFERPVCLFLRHAFVAACNFIGMKTHTIQSLWMEWLETF